MLHQSKMDVYAFLIEGVKWQTMGNILQRLDGDTYQFVAPT